MDFASKAEGRRFNHQLAEVKKQRDELLAALEGLMKWIAPQPFREQGDEHPVTVARAAIAKAKG